MCRLVPVVTQNVLVTNGLLMGALYDGGMRDSVVRATFNEMAAPKPGGRASLAYSTNPAVGGSAERITLAEALPSSFVFAGRDPNIERVAFRLTGYPPGDPENHPGALFRRDLEKGLNHSACHLLVLADGGIVRDERNLRPLNRDPQAIPGRNERCLAVYLEGDRHITHSQMGTVRDIASTVEGLTHRPVTVLPASYMETLAVSTSVPALAQAAGRPSMAPVRVASRTASH